MVITLDAVEEMHLKPEVRKALLPYRKDFSTTAPYTHVTYEIPFCEMEEVFGDGREARYGGGDAPS